MTVGAGVFNRTDKAARETTIEPYGVTFLRYYPVYRI
jgi:hypothetical protein